MEKHGLDLICCYSWGSCCAPFSCIFKWLLAFCKTFPEPASIMSSSCKQITYFSINWVKTAGAFAIHLMVRVQSSSMQLCSHSVRSYQLPLAENSQHSHTLIVHHIQWLFRSTNPPGLLQFFWSLVTSASSITQQNTQRNALVMFGRTEKNSVNCTIVPYRRKKTQEALEAALSRAVWETARKGQLLPKEGVTTAISHYLPHSRWHSNVSDLLPPLLAKALLSILPSDKECHPEEWEGNTKVGEEGSCLSLREGDGFLICACPGQLIGESYSSEAG